MRAHVALLLTLAAAPLAAQQERLPNLVVIFVDDMAYADIGPFGGTFAPTPNLDRLAAEGMRLSDFHAATAVCSASRAALLTGCHPGRVGIQGALGPNATHGLDPAETTLAEVCKQKGYATACFGKWHLGHHPKFLPANHGFDEYFGLPYSNDMWPLHPDYVDLPEASKKRKQGYPNLPLIEGSRVVDDEVTGEDQEQLTTWYTERAVDFIARHRSEPFFLYVPHSMVHVPLFVSDKFRGKSQSGLFGDVVMEIDWSVGQIMAALDEHGLTKDTLVVFTSDNGPWLSYGDHAGSAGPLREGKGTMWEGGHREPTIARWPGRIPKGSVCDELAVTFDLLPTWAAVIGADLPRLPIDGKDIRPLLFAEPGAVSPHAAFACYYDGQLQAIRDRRWKLVFPHRYRTLAGKPGGTGGRPVDYAQASCGLELYDLAADPGEQTDVAADHPDVVARLQAAAEAARAELGDTLQKKTGSAVRPAARLGPDDARLVW